MEREILLIKRVPHASPLFCVLPLVLPNVKTIDKERLAVWSHAFERPLGINAHGVWQSFLIWFSISILSV